MGKKKKLKQKRDWRNTEKNIMLSFFKIRRRRLTAFMKVITHLGDGWLWFSVCLVFLIINTSAGIALSLASLVQIALQMLIKRLFTRERPYIRHKEIKNLMLPPDRFSFPSGHTAGAFVMVFVFMFFYPILVIPFLILAVFVATSRVYLGLHYPTDVLAGVALGFISAWIGVHSSLLINF